MYNVFSSKQSKSLKYATGFKQDVENGIHFNIETAEEIRVVVEH